MYIHLYYTNAKIGWSEEKNLELIRRRDASFQELLAAPALELRDNATRPHQRLALVWFREYVWAVPFVLNGDEVFFKTAYPSRVHTKEFRRRRMS